MEIVNGIAFIEDADGKKFQVLNEDGTDWDEAATRAAYYAAHPELVK